MPPKKEHVFVVYGTTKDGVAAPFEAHHTNDNAKEAAEAHKSKGATDVAVKKLEVKTGVEAAAAKEKETKSPIKSPTKSKSPRAKSAGIVDNSDDDEEDEAPKAQKAAPKKGKKVDETRKIAPEGKNNALAGIKLLFTGTLEMDRSTCNDTAKKYGAKVVSKLEDTDYIILGTKPGPAKVDTINKLGLETISESEFMELLKTGVSQEKRDRMAAKAEAEEAEEQPAKKKQKK